MSRFWRVAALAVALSGTSLALPQAALAAVPSASADVEPSRSPRQPVRIVRATAQSTAKNPQPTRRQRRAGERASARQRITVDSRSAAISFDVTRHGFSFANWSDLGPTDDASIATLRRLFDDRSVCEVVDEAGTCTPFSMASKFLERLNAELTKGRCEGLAITAFRYFSLGRSDASMIALNDVVDDVNFWSATQVLPAARRQTDASRKLSLREIAGTVLDNLRVGGGATLGLHETSRAHTVLPISIRIDGDVALIEVYETNTPGRSQTLRLDLATDSWTYETVDHAGSVVDRWSGTKNLSVLEPTARRPISTDAFRSTQN